jgi:hypothetical protein
MRQAREKGWDVTSCCCCCCCSSVNKARVNRSISVLFGVMHTVEAPLTITMNATSTITLLLLLLLLGLLPQHRWIVAQQRYRVCIHDNRKTKTNSCAACYPPIYSHHHRTPLLNDYPALHLKPALPMRQQETKGRGRGHCALVSFPQLYNRKPRYL